MNLDKIRVAVRPMSTSQAIDLGFMMARHWFIPLWKIWCAMALPAFIIFALLPIMIFSGSIKDDSYKYIMFAGFLMYWWFKPLYEKPLVQWLGVAMFAEQPEVKASIKQGFKNYFQHAGKLLFRKRLSPARNIVLPILLLEQPENKVFSARFNLLQRGQGSGISWFMLIMVHIEFILIIGLVTFLMQLVPTEYMHFEQAMSYIDMLPVMAEVLYVVLYFLVLSIVAPFFICGGFSIYLTKRCLLEGWDVEIIFKSMANKYITKQQNPLEQLKVSKSVTREDV